MTAILISAEMARGAHDAKEVIDRVGSFVHRRHTDTGSVRYSAEWCGEPMIMVLLVCSDDELSFDVAFSRSLAPGEDGGDHECRRGSHCVMSAASCGQANETVC